jgi:DNA-binding transcriptional MerR regulator
MAVQRSFTTGQIAEQLGISPDTLRRHIRSGTIVPSSRSLGGQAHFMPADVAEIRARLQRPAREALQILDARAFRHRRDFDELKAQQGITAPVDVAALYDADTPVGELDAYAAELDRFRDV